MTGQLRSGQREWSPARVRRVLGHVADAPYLRHQWNTRVVKTRFGLLTLQDFVTDRRYGGSCSGAYKGRLGDLGYHGTSSAHYYYLGRIFRHVPVGREDVLVDVGCGKGRVLNFWLREGWANRMVGIEIDPRFADGAAKRLAKHGNVQVACGDVFDVLPTDGTVFFLFNPFGKDVVARFKDMLTAVHDPAKPLSVVYYACKARDVFDSDPDWVVTPVPEKVYHQAIVARYQPRDRTG